MQREVGGVAILSWAWVKIQVKIANKSTTFAFIVPDTEDFDILVP